MPLRRPLDPNFPIDRQLGIETGPVLLVNVFTLDKADELSLTHFESFVPARTLRRP